MDVIKALELRVVGMSRSGDHAIIGWILARADGRVASGPRPSRPRAANLWCS